MARAGRGLADCLPGRRWAVGGAGGNSGRARGCVSVGVGVIGGPMREEAQLSNELGRHAHYRFELAGTSWCQHPDDSHLSDGFISS